VTDPGVADLLDRLRGGQSWPAERSLHRLIPGLAARSGRWFLDPLVPRQRPLAEALGPNLVVVYEPDSVLDLALLWNLRAAHGLPPGLPLAIPANTDVLSSLRAVTDNHLWQVWGLEGLRCGLASMTLTVERLQELATDAGGPWEAVRPADVLQVAERPFRSSTDVATFTAGAAILSSWAPADRDALAPRAGVGRQLDLILRVRPQDRQLPRSPTLELDQPGIESGYRWGAWEGDAGGPDGLVTAHWPDGWSVLEAVVRDYGLEARRSPAGLAASALLRRLGDPNELLPLLDERLLGKLEPLGESAAMSWFRGRARELAAAAAEAAGEDPARGVEDIRSTLASMSARPDDADQTDVTYNSLREVFGGRRNETEAWLRWAEDRGLLLRGTMVSCKRCGTKGWRTVAELAPPVICRGCGEFIDRPFPSADLLRFRYRATELLLRVLDADTLVHLLTMRFFCTLFDESFRPPRLYGAYPGVDFFEPGSADQVGEADVLLIFTSGRLVPIECKVRSAGLTDDELAKLERLGERLRSPWTCVATTDRAASCSDRWQPDLNADRPRYAITAEHLLDPGPYGGLGDEPWGWRVEDDVAHEARHTQFVQSIGELLNYLDA
jgi:hypothetical protein